MPTHTISSDKKLNPELRRELGQLRGSIMEQANTNPLPSRFTVHPNPNSPLVCIKDTTNGKTTEVPLFAYGNVRKALNDLLN